MHDHQHLLVVDLVVLLCVGEALQHEAYQVGQSIFLLLQQDSPCGEVGCVTFQVEGTGLGQESEHWGRGDSTLQHIKGLLFGHSPSTWRGQAILEKLWMNLW